MKTFLRENPTIAFGLGLPLLLVMAFLLMSGIPALVVAPPQYDVLYSTGYYNHQNGLQISVINQNVQVSYQGNLQNNRKPQIWRYNPETNAVREVAWIMPSGLTPPGKKSAGTEQTSKITPVEVPDLKGLTVDSSNIAPDGYRFNKANSRYSNNVFGGLFYSSRYRHESVLTKSGRSIRLPHIEDQYYRGNTHFIGWVVSP